MSLFYFEWNCLQCFTRGCYPHCDQACESKLRDIDERFKALQKEIVALDRRDNELLAEKKQLSEQKGKKRQLEQKMSTKQDR